VTDTAVVLLGIMTVALVIMAVVQIGLIVVALRVARQVTTTAETFRRELRPLIDKIGVVTDDAARVTALALTQMERVNHALASTSQRVDATVSMIEGLVARPVRRSAAVVAAFKAALGVVRQVQTRRRIRREAEDDALFVG
jgi:hypothetical protein